ncbi:uncharacterized protein LOC108248300 [Kryptolebias marmoratus]|uniref:uncharacterized protein LOC108248300 n=1 Tax=Kryptolebias marmoratus TaxID=37003 RepID=UPI0007F925C7|nr:uncharacterized protein LOC108248300 [Kryptolebias marmoratus]
MTDHKTVSVFVFGLVSGLILPLWKYPNVPKEEPRIQNKELKEEFKPELETFPKQNQSPDLLLPPGIGSLSGSVPLLLIHACGAAVAAVSLHIFSMDGFFNLLSGLTAVYSLRKLKRKNEELIKAKSQLETEVEVNEQEYKDTLMEMKIKLESRRDQLRTKLEEVEAERAENKQKLQSVENKITEENTTFDKSEDLIVVKEDLLKDRWKLNQIKKNTEEQILNTEKLMEPLETRGNKLQRQEVE